MDETMSERVQDLSDRCADTYTPEDIIEHLEEELIECLLAIKRVRRGKGLLADFIEEMFDVTIEINTVLTTLNYNGKGIERYDYLKNMKLDKFESMLNRDERKIGEQPKIRYRPMCKW